MTRCKHLTTDHLTSDLGGGFPHSEIHGSKLVRSSPRLIAAYHVLHRLSVPRHPPNALKSLDHSHYQCPPARSRRWNAHEANEQHQDQHPSEQTMRSRPVPPRSRRTGLRKTSVTEICPTAGGQASELALTRPCGHARTTLLFTMSANRRRRRQHRRKLFPSIEDHNGQSAIARGGRRTNPKDWWSQTGSNRRPPACKAGALPTELWPRSLRPRGPLLSEPPGKWWAWVDSNYRPHAYQGCALTN